MYIEINKVKLQVENALKELAGSQQKFNDLTRTWYENLYHKGVFNIVTELETMLNLYESPSQAYSRE